MTGTIQEAAMAGGDQDGYDVSPERLRAIAGRLRETQQDLDGRAPGAPEAPFAGVASGLVAQALAAVFRSVGSVSAGLAESAQAVDDNATGYADADQRVAGAASAVEER
jgi:hypothetical protein